MYKEQTNIDGNDQNQAILRVSHGDFCCGGSPCVWVMTFMVWIRFSLVRLLPVHGMGPEVQ